MSAEELIALFKVVEWSPEGLIDRDWEEAVVLIGGTMCMKLQVCMCVCIYA